MERWSPYAGRLSPVIVAAAFVAFAARAVILWASPRHGPPSAVLQPRGVAGSLAPPVWPPAPSPPPPRPPPTIVKLLQPAPAIFPGAAAPHAPRGECARCHRMRPTPPFVPAPVSTVAMTTDLREPTNAPVAAAAAASAPPPTAAPPPSTAAASPMPVAPPPANAAPGHAEMPAVTNHLPLDKPWDWTAARTGGSPGGAPLPFMEGHWQGLEVIPLWPNLARALKIPNTTAGVVIDETTQPADAQGFAAGDVVMAVGRLATPSVASFLTAADAVRDAPAVDILVFRKGEVQTITLSAPRLGVANGETAPMIPPGAPRPHGYIGPCTNCHRIGTKGSIPVDPADLFPKTAPPIVAGQRATHRDFGPCRACHTIK